MSTTINPETLASIPEDLRDAAEKCWSHQRAENEKVGIPDEPIVVCLEACGERMILMPVSVAGFDRASRQIDRVQSAETYAIEAIWYIAGQQGEGRKAAAEYLRKRRNLHPSKKLLYIEIASAMGKMDGDDSDVKKL